MHTPHVLHLVQVDFVEVYQDQVRDLLINPNEDGTTRMPSIDVRESPTQGVFLEGVRYVAIALLVMKAVHAAATEDRQISLTIALLTQCSCF